MNIIELSNKAYQSAKRRGLYDKEQPLEHYLMLVIDEISECHKASLEGIESEVGDFNDYIGNISTSVTGRAYDIIWLDVFDDYIKDSIPDELADICIMCFSALGWKMETMSKFEVEIIERNFVSISEVYFEPISQLLTTLSFRAAIADIEYVAAYVTRYCKDNNIDLEWHVEQKMRYNELRER